MNLHQIKTLIHDNQLTAKVIVHAICTARLQVTEDAWQYARNIAHNRTAQTS